MLNHIVIMGRLVANPELKSTNNGTKVCSYRIACDRDYGRGEEKQTDFVDCVAWRSTAEFICRNFQKGMPILIEGRLQVRDYVDKDNNKRRVCEINTDSAYFCGGEHVAKKESAPTLADIEDDGELPWEV